MSREEIRELRREQTAAETVLWDLLRDRRLLGLKFRRQCPISRYVADFCCKDQRLILELDGEVHEEERQASHDQNRDAYLRSLGYVILRFPNRQLFDNPSSVLQEITRTAPCLRPGLAYRKP